MIKLRVYAKLNLALNVLSCEQDGYHQLDMVNQSISLFDEIRIIPRPDERISVHCDKNIGVINTAWTAVSEFAKKFNTTGCDITIKKGIPMKGGLGGSSADAAGVLVALAKWHKIPLEQVYPIAEIVGSDVKYMMTGGLARVGGKGEKVQTVESDSLVYFVVIMPQFGLSTRKVFETFDQNPDFNFANNDELIKAVKNEDLPQIRNHIRNGLQQTAFDIEPKLKDIFEKASKYGKVCMTGSGSCLFLVADSLVESQYLAEKLCKQDIFAVPAESRAFGVEFVEFKP